MADKWFYFFFPICVGTNVELEGGASASQSISTVLPT